MTTQQNWAEEQSKYWNETGGERWVRYIERLERQLSGLSEALIKAVDAQPGEKILDVGCGGGPTSAAYARAVGDTGSVLGVDISGVILEHARQRHAAVGNLRFENADAGAHTFERGVFDVVTSRFGVMFFGDPVAAFTNLRGALADDGRLCFMCWRSIQENPWMGAAAAAAFTVIPAPEKPAPGAPGPFSLADVGRLRGVLGSAGFGRIDIEPVDQNICLGQVDDALDWLTHMGPAAVPLSEAGEAEREAARGAMREVLAAHDTPEGVTFPGGAWLVRARPV